MLIIKKCKKAKYYTERKHFNTGTQVFRLYIIVTAKKSFVHTYIRQLFRKFLRHLTFDDVVLSIFFQSMFILKYVRY